jgi:hypothetical protein
MANDGDSATDCNRFHLNRILYPLLAGTTLLIAACASVPPPPVLSARDPASPQAKEGSEMALQSTLGPDEATQKTQDLIVNQRKNSNPQESDQPGGMSQMPGMKMGGAK